MVSSIKHWEIACDVIQDAQSDDGFDIWKIGTFLFGNQVIGAKAHDEFLEYDASVWLIH